MLDHCFHNLLFPNSQDWWSLEFYVNEGGRERGGSSEKLEGENIVTKYDLLFCEY